MSEVQKCPVCNKLFTKGSTCGIFGDENGSKICCNLCRPCRKETVLVDVPNMTFEDIWGPQGKDNE